MRCAHVLGLVAATLWPAAAAADDAPAKRSISFGSYGRVVVGTDLRGGAPDAVAVVEHGPRVVEDTYLELDVYYDEGGLRDIDVRSVATLAFGDALFHDTGEFDADIAIRNLYAEATLGSASVWVGSRMYRGDDIYLLDYWPLDDYNTVGGGARWRTGALDLRGHVGVNRLRDPFQLQEVVVPAPDSGGAVVEQLDRQRFVATLTPAYRVLDTDGLKLKLVLHGDIQAINNGRFRREDETFEALPSDFGWTVGAQVGAWGFSSGAHDHVNAFVKYGRGLAAFDELAVPTGLDEDLRASGASELILAVSGAYQFPGGGAMVAAYARRFVDADTNVEDRDDGWAYAVDARPYAALLDVLHVAVDVSYQKRFPRGASPIALEVLEPAVFQIAPMVILSPKGDAPYARPHLRLVYSAAHQNDGALDLYPLEDPRRGFTWQHFFGAQAEWWLGSSTYSEH